MQPLDTNLNVAIAHVALRLIPAGFDVSEHAPPTFDQLTAHLDAGKRMVVFSGGSDVTIYADPEVNWHFRAWHDWCHWRGNHPFSLAGETAVFRMQAEHLIGLYGNGPDVQRWIRIIHAEIVGQAEFYEVHGHFPEDQYAFVVAYLAAAKRISTPNVWQLPLLGPQPPSADASALTRMDPLNQTTPLSLAKTR